MKFLLIRHAQTDANRLTRGTFGAEGAPLNSVGYAQARGLQDALLDREIDLINTPVAVSQLLRTRQTAKAAGLRNISIEFLLNEVNTSDPTQTQNLLAARKLPKEALMAADKLLSNPPAQPIWVTHGLIIMGLLEWLGMTNPEHFIPDYCEIVEIEF